MKGETRSYQSFLNAVSGKCISVLKENSSVFVEHFRPGDQVPSHFAPTSFLLDYSTKRYLYVDDSCLDLLGYKASYFLETGVEEYLAKLHPDDFDIIDNTVFPANLMFLKSLAPADYSHYIFSYNYRMLNARGEYITVLQRFSYIPDGRNKVAGVIGVIFDITHFKNDTSITHTIERTSMLQDGVVTDLLYKKVHPVTGQRKNLLTQKEIEIVRAISCGLASKQIAKEMELSINTINNHRRNMLSKTGCRSSSELINYAVKHGLV